ncbi:MAG: ABC-F family ATP-binding cassette domain-containing protein [Lactobacillus iners]|nr:ABC-F family ATP-binding cassette domain-containing protein [Lactobacillus iners]
MIIAQAKNLEQHFGINQIFNDVDFSISDNARIGLVGPNGAGKTTLLKIMTGQQEPSGGNFTINKDIIVGYIAQENGLNENNSIWEEMLTVFASLVDKSHKIEQLQIDISNDPENQDLLKQYDQLSYSFEQAGGFTYPAEIKSVLNGFKFFQDSWHKKISTLSGGEKTRLAFVKLLLKKPPLLLLDEPTNHLDLDTLEWLEGFLKNYKGAILTVSHDQYFLDNLTNEIFELNFGKLTTFQERELINRQQEAAFEKQQEQIKRDEEFIQKNIVRASTTKRAQSRQKRLDKIERITLPQHKQKVRINFNAERQSGKEVLILKDVTIGYPDKIMVKNINFQVNKGDRIAIIGPNGIGKSTLLKTLMHKLEPKTGTIKYGAGLDIGYYDQELQSLDFKQTVLDTIWNRHKTMPESEVRSILASFLFNAKDIEKTVAQLSGGQRARLTLTVLSMEKDNFLLMDEPTNHLDIEAKEVLEQALDHYDGTLLFVSHDRYFINELANKIIVINNGTAKLYNGNYHYYLDELTKQNAIEASKQEEIITNEDNSGKLSYAEQKERNSQKRKLERDVQNAEKKIAELEEKEKDIQLKMADPIISASFEKLGPLQEELSQIQSELEKANETWEEAMLNLDEFE